MKLNKTTPIPIQLLPRPNRLDVAYDAIDELHSAISEGRLDILSEFQNRTELLNWLRDVIYTAQETIIELEKAETQPEPMLRVISNDPPFIVLERVD